MFGGGGGDGGRHLLDILTRIGGDAGKLVLLLVESSGERRQDAGIFAAQTGDAIAQLDRLVGGGGGHGAGGFIGAAPRIHRRFGDDSALALGGDSNGVGDIVDATRGRRDGFGKLGALARRRIVDGIGQGADFALRGGGSLLQPRHLAFGGDIDLARLACQPRGDVVQSAGLALEHAFQALAGGNGSIAGGGQLLGLNAQRGAHDRNARFRIFGRIGQGIEASSEQIAGVRQPASDHRIQQNEPQKGERRENTGDKDAKLMRQQEEEVIPADLLADIVGAQPKPDRGQRRADRNHHDELFFCWRHRALIPNPPARPQTALARSPTTTLTIGGATPGVDPKCWQEQRKAGKAGNFPLCPAGSFEVALVSSSGRPAWPMSASHPGGGRPPPDAPDRDVRHRRGPTPRHVCHW